MTAAEIRAKYLSFFQNHGHVVIPSSSLLPENDATTLFTGSGMQPMVPYLLGQVHPHGSRIADSQKCFRGQDIEEVGDNRHTTFFEMLGNWSLGDYFKSEQIAWMFEFLTTVIGLDPSRLYVTAFAGNEALGVLRDEETAALWRRLFAQAGLTDERVFFYDEKYNWWSRSGLPDNMPVGEPGGPDSEMFWDFGAAGGWHERSLYSQALCHVNCDCGRYLEIGNNVFMQYRKTARGFELLPKRNVDFGGGLERLAAARLNDPDIFNIDLFDQARNALMILAGKPYGSRADETRNFRIVLDHLRAATFLIGDGAVPSNKDQGYYTRRLIRRAVRCGQKLGVSEAFCGAVAAAFIDTYLEIYPNLAEQRQAILSTLAQEESKFRATLAKGEKEFERMFATGKISGRDAFVLYTTYGFPLELVEEMAIEKGQVVDREAFAREFRQHQELSRAGSEQKFAGGLADHSLATTRLHTATHLLHQALRTVLGEHVFQRGSNITQERLRFDFSHPRKLTAEEINRVEELVNNIIAAKLPVHYEILDIGEAKRRGAIGLFEDKYAALGDKIKVYFVGDYSREVCGGPHVENTGELGRFKIIKEEAVATGVRRIKAVVASA